MPLASDDTMLQKTCVRLAGIDHQTSIFVCGEDHRFIVAEQLREMQIAHNEILLEPAERNAAPAIALAAMQALKDDAIGDPILLVLAADHVIKEVAAFRQTVVIAEQHAQKGRLVLNRARQKQAVAEAATDADFVRPAKSAFLNCPDDSIDYAVMEKTNDAVVVPLSCGWSDVGSWSALWDIADKDAQGNATFGDVMTVDSQNCYVRSDSKLIATIGMDNAVIVESDDVILVASKDQVQKVKSIVETLNAENRSESRLHRKVYRPWGVMIP